MALTTAKRPSELAALLCDDNHFRWEEGTFALSPPASPRRTVQVTLRLHSTSSPGRRSYVFVPRRPFVSFCWKEFDWVSSIVPYFLAGLFPIVQ
jgi:hypothetical protein